jgi:hypothetical protein
MSDPTASAPPESSTPPAEAPPGAGEAPPASQSEPSGPARGPDGKFASPGNFDELEGTYDELLAGEGDTVTIPKAHLEKMRGEHKSYRERWKPVEKALAPLHPDDREDFLRFAHDIAIDEARPQAVEWMRNVLDSLTPKQQAQVKEAIAAERQAAGAPAPEGEDEWDPLDPEQVDARVKAQAEKIVEEKLTAREQKAAVEEATNRIKATATELGYKTDPRDPEYGLLLFTARERFGGDLRKAHEAIEADLNDRAVKILEAKRTDAAKPTAPRTGQAPTGQRKASGSLKDVESAARERLDAILDGPR